MEDLISIVVPAYNAEKYIETCINSIRNQSYKNIEIIIVNDGSNDSTLNIITKLKEEDSRITVISTENKGVSHARNTGMQVANGKWISFVDSDDWLEESFCEKLINKAKELNADYIGCGYNKITNDNIQKVNDDEKVLTFTKDEYLIKLLNVQTSYGLSHMKMIKTELAKKVKFNESLVVAEDALYNIELCEYLNKIVIYNVPLYNFRINTDSVVRKYDKNYNLKYANAMEKVSKFIKEKYQNEEVITNLNNFIVYHLMLVCVNYVYNPENECNIRIKLLKDICESNIYKDAVKNSNYNELSITRKITLFTIKYKLYMITSLICKIRQKQIRK